MRPLPPQDAAKIADALELFAGIDEGENTDDDELVRLARSVRASVEPDDVWLITWDHRENPTAEEITDAAVGGFVHFHLVEDTGSDQCAFVAAKRHLEQPEVEDAFRRVMAEYDRV